MLDAVRRKAESSVASCGADTGMESGDGVHIEEVMICAVGRNRITLIEERVGQLHFLKELLRRVFIDVELVAWQAYMDHPFPLL
jgi:hypothetical protein